MTGLSKQHIATLKNAAKKLIGAKKNGRFKRKWSLII
jgi:hypothetical protein